MKVLVLTVTCGLVTALQALDPLPLALEGQNITGTWYLEAVVADGGLNERKKPEAVSPIMLDVLDGGYVEASLTFLKSGRCHEAKVMIHSTGEPGKFSLSGGKRDLYLKPLPVRDHYSLYYEYQSHGRRFRVGKLMGRSPDASPEALEAFQKFAQSMGLPLGNIALPAQMERCIPESD